MLSDRRLILSLVASGRITSAEAERLLLASSASWDWLWAIAVCALVCFSQIHLASAAAALGHALQLFAAGAGERLQTVLGIWGGKL